MKIICGVQNMKHNGWGTAIGDADPSFDRLPLIIDRLQPLGLDLLILNETRSRGRHPWPQSWKARIRHLARALDMRIAGITPSQNRTPSVLLYRPGSMGHPIWWDTSQQALFQHGYGVAAFNIEGLPMPLSVGAVHLTPFSYHQAATEVKTLIGRCYRKGSIGIFGGDLNYCLYGSDPHWEDALPHNIMNRAIINGGASLADVEIWQPDGTLNPEVDIQPNFLIADEIARGDMHDVAWDLYKRSRTASAPDESLLQVTGGHARVDGLAVTGALRPAITRYAVASAPEGASDHHAAICELETTLVNPQRIFGYK